MTTLMNDQQVAQRILDHLKLGTTDCGDEVWREPVENYRSPSRFAAEIETVFHQTPTPFCPSAALSEPGSYLARDAAGTPLLAVRTQSGAVRVFRNACRHRGMLLAEGSGCAKALVCPYHGWSYALDGSLQGVPHQHGFPGLDKESHGLVEVRATEQGGLLFVTQDQPLRQAQSPDLIPDLLAPEQQFLGSRELEVAANWKILLEGFLEGYHIRPTHTETFYPYGFDNLNVIETFGKNSRVTFPFRRIAKLADVPSAQRRVEGLLTYVYHLFPNVLVTVLTHHTVVVILEPIAIDRTKMVSYLVTNRGSSTPDMRETVERDIVFVDKTGAAEDRAVVAAIQRSLNSRANTVFTFGLFESAIVHFHRTLNTTLAEAGQG